MILFCAQSPNYPNVIVNLITSKKIEFPTIMYIDSNSIIKITNNANNVSFSLASYW